MIDEIIFTFSKLRNGIDEKYNLSIERANILSNDQINSYISNNIQFDHQSQEMKRRMCSDFLNKLNNLVIELDQLNYQISKENKDHADKLYQEDKALAIYPKHVFSLFGKGQALFDMGQKEKSIEWFDKALAFDLKHVDSLLFWKGDALRMLGQFKESIKWFDKALAIDPLRVFSLGGKGMVYKCILQGQTLNELGKYQEAFNVLSQALKLASGNQFIQNALNFSKQKLNK